MLFPFLLTLSLSYTLSLPRQFFFLPLSLLTFHSLSLSIFSFLSFFLSLFALKKGKVSYKVKDQTRAQSSENDKSSKEDEKVRSTLNLPPSLFHRLALSLPLSPFLSQHLFQSLEEDFQPNSGFIFKPKIPFKTFRSPVTKKFITSLSLSLSYSFSRTLWIVFSLFISLSLFLPFLSLVISLLQPQTFILCAAQSKLKPEPVLFLNEEAWLNFPIEVCCCSLLLRWLFLIRQSSLPMIL